MTGSTTNGLSAVSNTARFDIQAVTLPGGWSGSVLTGCAASASGVLKSSSLPVLEDWQCFLRQLVADPAATPGYAVLKYSKTGEVFRARLSWENRSVDVACKQSRVRGFSRRLLARWRKPRERTDFNRGLALLRAGVPTARPLALVERRSPRCEAWLITEFIPEAVDLDQVVLTELSRLEPARRHGVKSAIAEAIVDLVISLERHGFCHRDLKASNILLTNRPGGRGPVCLWLVDLEGLRLVGPSSERRRWQPLIRLTASLLDYGAVTRCDYCRFLQAYIARSGIPRKMWKRHFRKLAQKAANYLRRSRKRKTHKLDGYAGKDVAQSGTVL